MGIVLAKFRRKRTTVEILEELDMKIKEIEQYGQNTEQKHKKIVGRLVIYSVILYIITAFIFYFYFFPASLFDQIFYISPLLLFPILILFTKKIVSSYYKRKISNNQKKLASMESEKSKILEQVTETETYKKAKEILLKFAPDQLRMTPLSPQPTYKVTPSSETPHRPNTPQAIVTPLPGAGELRRRILSTQNQPPHTQAGMPSNTGLIPVGASPIQSPQPRTPFQPGAKIINTASTDYRPPLPRPILPRQRTYVDRLVDYLVGDGPSNRYALICRQCGSHNGMALKEEFEYFGYRCCYCNFWNPARKQKSTAPKLEQTNMSTTIPSTASLDSSAVSEHSLPNTNPFAMDLEEGESSSVSDTDSDIEVVERPGENSEVAELLEHTGEGSTKNDEEESGTTTGVETKKANDSVTPMEVE